jgi:hypothetical protein
VTLRFRIWWISSSTISRSTKSSGRSRRSTTVTSTPSTAKIDAYSIPMTPPPTTVIARGRRLRPTMSSLVIATSPSRTAPGGVTARVPTATTIEAARTARVPDSDRTSSVCGSWNRASPRITVTSLRRSWSSRTSISRRTLTRARSCSAVGRAGPDGARTAHTASRNVLLGMVPVSTQMPPTHRFFSTTATRLPSLAAWTAARWPAGPLPIATRSKS